MIYGGLCADRLLCVGDLGLTDSLVCHPEVTYRIYENHCSITFGRRSTPRASQAIESMPGIATHNHSPNSRVAPTAPHYNNCNADHFGYLIELRGARRLGKRCMSGLAHRL